jgi:hypothetical protein
MSDSTAPLFGEGYPYERAQQNALELEALLRQHGLTVRLGSALEQVVLSTFDIVYRKQGSGKVPAAEDIRIGYRNLIGVNELSSLLLSVRDHPDFGQLIPHLQLLNEGMALQNVRSSQTDAATNKVFELFAACLALQCGTNVTLDSPRKSKGDNPDVLADVAGKRWGIACKVLHSISPESFIQNLEKGLEQIERSPAKVGVVMFNLKNIIDHDRYWPVTDPGRPEEGIGANYGAFTQPDAAFAMLRQEISALGASIQRYLPEGYLASVFRDKKSVPAFLLWAHTAASVIVNGRPAPTSVRAGIGVFTEPVKHEEADVLDCLHWAAFADSLMRGPNPLTGGPSKLPAD